MSIFRRVWCLTGSSRTGGTQRGDRLCGHQGGWKQWVPSEVWIETHYPEHRALMYDLERTTSHSGLITDASRSLWFDHMSEYLSEIQAEPADEPRTVRLSEQIAGESC